MQLRQLEYVAAIVQWKTMRRAAQELYISEATISEQIRALEAEFGFSLFEREKLLRLTPAAEQLLPDLYTLLQAKQALEQRVAEIKNPAAGQIRLGITPIPAALFLPTILQKFRQRYPKVQVDIYEGRTYEIAEQLEDHHLDIAIFTVSDLVPFNFNKLIHQPLMKPEFVALTSRHHRLAHKERISRAQLSQEEIVVYFAKTTYQSLLQEMLGPHFEPNIVYSTNHPQSAISLVQAGIGITFLPRYLVEAQQMAGRLRDLTILDLAPELAHSIQQFHHVCAYPQQQHQSKQVRVLADIIRECFHAYSYTLQS